MPESPPSVWVRCSNGAYYENPVIMVPGGFISFPHIAPEVLELTSLGSLNGLCHLWDLGEQTQTMEQVAEEALGAGGCAKLTELGKLDRVQVPGDAMPPRFLPAWGASFELLRPIPEPQIHGEVQRYKSRLRRAMVLDPEPAAR